MKKAGSVILAAGILITAFIGLSVTKGNMLSADTSYKADSTMVVSAALKSKPHEIVIWIHE